MYNEGLDAINKLNNSIFLKATESIRALLPSEDELIENSRKEVERLKQNHDAPDNKILLAFYDLEEQYRTCTDEERKEYLLEAMKQKCDELNTYYKQTDEPHEEA